MKSPIFFLVALLATIVAASPVAEVDTRAEVRKPTLYGADSH
uniref:Uncharacterized protein n=1 Tax=Moniliophthora roreri TaxID=221103 RepID=A0A0W0G2X9_MONRR